MTFGESHIFDARVVSFSGSPASNSLRQYGLSFDDLNILQEYGLIISDYNSWMNYAPCIVNEKMEVGMKLSYCKKHFGLVPTDREKYDKTVKLNGVTLTQAGKELLKIIPLEESSNYSKALEEFFEQKHLKLVEIKK